MALPLSHCNRITLCDPAARTAREKLSRARASGSLAATTFGCGKGGRIGRHPAVPVTAPGRRRRGDGRARTRRGTSPSPRR
jgi:hypothetical protein